LHDLGISTGNATLNVNNASTRLSPEHSIGIYIMSNPIFLASSMEELCMHPKLKLCITLPYTADTPAPPHISGFYIVLFAQTAAPSLPSGSPALPVQLPLLPSLPPPASSPTSPSLLYQRRTLTPFLLPWLSWGRQSSSSIPLSISSFSPATSSSQPYIHTIYNAHPTYSMMLPTILVESYWYLLPFTSKPPNFKYPMKDYAMWAMHFLAHSCDNDGLKQITSTFLELQSPLITPYVHPTPPAPSTCTPQKVRISFGH
jgi:hypothetical protein